EALAAAGLAIGALAAGAAGTIAGALLPPACRLAWLRRRAGRREAQVRRDLPFVLDLLAMAVEGGLAASAALDLAARRGPAGPLRDGLALVVAGMAAGRSRADALAELRRTLPYPEIAALVATLDQTDRLGGRLAPALRIQAEQRRQERWHSAERRALLAPVRLLLPLALCILPATFVVLLVPLALRLTAGLTP
ncbi:MAG TPA: type II secretion system F family protein, partial [Thermodesulfobacteriota bacterium]